LVRAGLACGCGLRSNAGRRVGQQSERRPAAVAPTSASSGLGVRHVGHSGTQANSSMFGQLS
jgi:hypothetical protein